MQIFQVVNIMDQLHFLHGIQILDIESNSRRFVSRFFVSRNHGSVEGVNIFAKRDYKSSHCEELPSARNRVTMLFGCSLFDDANVTEWRTCSCSRDCVKSAVPCRAVHARRACGSKRLAVRAESLVFGTREISKITKSNIPREKLETSAMFESRTKETKKSKRSENG